MYVGEPSSQRVRETAGGDRIHIDPSVSFWRGPPGPNGLLPWMCSQECWTVCSVAAAPAAAVWGVVLLDAAGSGSWSVRPPGSWATVVSGLVAPKLLVPQRPTTRCCHSARGICMSVQCVRTSVLFRSRNGTDAIEDPYMNNGTSVRDLRFHHLVHGFGRRRFLKGATQTHHSNDTSSGRVTIFS